MKSVSIQIQFRLCGDDPWILIKERAGEEVRNQVWVYIWTYVDDQIWTQVWSQVRDHLR